MKRDSRCSTGKSALLTSNELLQVERFKCCHCGIIVTAKLELLDHLREEHGLNTEKAIRNVVNAGHLTSNRVPVQRYQCSHCFIFFPSKLELLDHLGKEHGLDVANALSAARRAGPVPSARSPPVRRFQCSHCVLIFESKLQLLQHLGKDHDLDVDKAIRNATLPPPGEATPSPKPSEEVATERSMSALQPEVNGLNGPPDTSSTVTGNKPVANEKSTPNEPELRSPIQNLRYLKRGQKVSTWTHHIRMRRQRTLLRKVLLRVHHIRMRRQRTLLRKVLLQALQREQRSSLNRYLKKTRLLAPLWTPLVLPAASDPRLPHRAVRRLGSARARVLRRRDPSAAQRRGPPPSVVLGSLGTAPLVARLRPDTRPPSRRSPAPEQKPPEAPPPTASETEAPPPTASETEAPPSETEAPPPATPSETEATGQGFFFCPQCNYGNQLIGRVMDHLKKSHPDGKISKRQIFGYTAEVYEQPRDEQLKFEALSRPPEPALGERTVVPFLCHRCDYGASNAYLLKRHLDKRAERVFDHYKEKHRSNVSSLKHIMNHFHMAPKDAPSKKAKDPTSPATRWAQGSATKKAKSFSCRRCSFKSISLTGLTKHKSRAHPSSVKGKASAPEDLSGEADDQNSCVMEADGQLDFNLAPQTLEPSPGLSPQSTPSSRVYMCRCCSLLFSTWQGLKIHYGMKHFEEWKSQPALFEEEAAVEGHRTEGNVVFKCPWCVYVHTTRHGVVSHCRARHRTKKVRAEGFEKRLAHVPHGSNGANPRSRVRVGGYMCQTCNEVCRSLVKFSLHDMKCRGDSGSCVLKPAAKYALTKQLLSKYQGALKKGFSKKSQAGLLKCPWCKHVEKSKEALAKHVNACSRSMRDVFKCTVCPYITLSNKYLKQHYRTAHGVESKTAAMEYTAVSYNCKLCPYVSSRRRYLLCHYTKSHGMDPPEEVKANTSFECQKCGQTLSSASGLAAHYTGVHLAHFQMDFKVLYRYAKRRAVAGYDCHRCGLQVRSTGELRVHLDLHREQQQQQQRGGGGASGRAVGPSSQSNRKGASPKPPTSPAPAPEKPRPRRAEAHACALCGRWFPSLLGLRVHERRSHGEDAAAGGPAPGPPAAQSTDRFDQCTQFRPGSLKAFHCLICAYRTNMLCLLKSHFRKKHPELPADRGAGPSGSLEVEGDGPPAAGDPPAEGNPPAPHPDLQRDPSPAPLPAVKTSKHSVYSEPAEVQRQLSHYRSMAPANSVAPLSAEAPGDRTLPCEFCDFSSGHWSSVRRHYMSSHGKKVHRCKDCCYFTGLRRKLDLHKKTGHARGPAAPPPPPPKRLRCPLCLYHTLSRDHLVDHVVLHRQERVVPIELRRPRLSRYLEGVVFRCQECTFTCGSAGALGAHALKHGAAGPYACRLCYFRCPRLGLLEAHLWDKHQVERNHELVGQLNLDHLGGGEDGQDAWPNPREGHREEEGVTPGWDGVQRRGEQEGRDATARQEEEGLRGQEEEEGLRGQEEEEGRRGQEEEEGQRRCDERPPAAPTGSEDGCPGGVGFTSKRRAEGEASALEVGRAVGPPGGPGAGDGPTRRSPPPSGAQGSSGASGSPPPAAPPVPDGAADTEPREEPSLSPEVPRDHRGGRGGRGDGLGSPEMPVLENVYLDRRLSGQGSLQRGEPPSGGGALGGSGGPGTSPTKAAPAAPSAAPRTRSGAPSAALSCPYCGRVFCTAAELQGHVKRHRM
ncbi:unnamed protein product [Boreogadus saida]